MCAMNNDLRPAYLNIEGAMNWPKKSDGYGRQQFYQLVMGLKSKVRERSLNEGLDPKIYEARLHKLLNFVFGLNGYSSYLVHGSGAFTLTPTLSLKGRGSYDPQSIRTSLW